MRLGYRRHIPVSLKEQMVVMHGVHRLPKHKVAAFMGVHPSTVRRALKNAYNTGSVIKEPLQNGGRRMLNGVDCAVCNPPCHCHLFD